MDARAHPAGARRSQCRQSYPSHMNYSPRCAPLAPDSCVATPGNRACYYSSSRLALGHDKHTSLSEKPMRDGYKRQRRLSWCACVGLPATSRPIRVRGGARSGACAHANESAFAPRTGTFDLVRAPVRRCSKEKSVVGDPGRNQHGIRALPPIGRLWSAVIFRRLAHLKMAGATAPRGTLK